MTEYLTATAMAKVLCVNRMTVMRLAKRGKIPFIAVGSTYRFDRDAVISALEKK